MLLGFGGFWLFLAIMAALDPGLWDDPVKAPWLQPIAALLALAFWIGLAVFVVGAARGLDEHFGRRKSK